MRHVRVLGRISVVPGAEFNDRQRTTVGGSSRTARLIRHRFVAGGPRPYSTVRARYLAPSDTGILHSGKASADTDAEEKRNEQRNH